MTARCEDLWIASSAAPDETIHLREKSAADGSATTGKALLFVHGATYPGVMFDVPGSSWLDHAVADGYATYALDVRGYGGSTRPAALDAPPLENAPFACAETAVADITDCIAFIRARAGVETIDLIGWSWGTMTTGMYAATRPGTLNRLVLFAPVYCQDRPSAWVAAMTDSRQPGELRPLGAYRTETVAQGRQRWDAEIRVDDKDSRRDPAIVERWFGAMLAYEPGAAVRAPNGVLMDLWEAANGRPRYDAARIEVPTLVIRGSDDATALRADALGLFDALASPHKQYAEIGHSTHFLVLERRARELFDSVSQFLSADSQ